MQKRHKFVWVTVGAALSLLLASWSYTAPPVRDRVLDEVSLVQSEEELYVEVLFSFPLRYRSHFPEDRARELRIRLQPVRVPASDLDAVPQRESVVPQYADVVSLEEVIYEGDIEGGPYLTVRFTRPVRYQVIPGSDYRSMRIVVQSVE